MKKPEFIRKLETYGIKLLLPVESLVYKYSSFETAVKIVESNRFLFSTPEKFNDPFDLTNSLIDKKVTFDIFNSWLESHQTEIIKKNALLKRAMSDETFIPSYLNKTLDEFKKIAGITCFSKSYKKTLMWSHYADKHSGITLGFNIYPMDPEKNFTMLQVNYTNKIKPLNFFLDKPFVLMNWLYTKSIVWKYEEEVRAVYTDRNGFLAFDKACLKEVHFGLRTTDEQRHYFLNLLQTLNYNVDRVTYMTMDSETFDLKENIWPAVNTA